MTTRELDVVSEANKNRRKKTARTTEGMFERTNELPKTEPALWPYLRYGIFHIYKCSLDILFQSKSVA